MSDEAQLLKDALAEDEAKVIDTASISNLVEEATTTKNKIDELEAEVKLKKKRLAVLLETEIPLKLNEIGSIGSTFVVGNYTVGVDLEYKVRGTINQAPDMEKAVAYLLSNGFEGQLLTKASVDFKEGELDEEKVSTLMDIFSTEFDKDVHLDRTINAQTLMAFVRTKISDGSGFDPSIVGATVMRQAKLSIK